MLLKSFVVLGMKDWDKEKVDLSFLSSSADSLFEFLNRFTTNRRAARRGTQSTKTMITTMKGEGQRREIERDY